MVSSQFRLPPFLFLLLATVVAGCNQPRQPRPNLLLVTIDTLRADHTSAYGYRLPTTPTLDQLAKDGALVEKAYVSCATTGPSHATLFTSLFPLQHGVVRNGLVLGAERVTLAETLRSVGYRTGAVVSSFVLDRRFGFDQGFDTYESKFDPAGETVVADRWEHMVVPGGFDRRADTTTDLALAWLRGRPPEKPFFLWVHYFDPHVPYTPPPPYADKFRESNPMFAAYDGEVAFTDAELGRLLAGLEADAASASTLVVVTADHGEGLMQHGHQGHGLQLYEEAVHVPLLARWVGHIPAGRRVPGPVESLDVAPTLLQMLAIKAPRSFQGSGFAAALGGDDRGVGFDPTRKVFMRRRLYESDPRVKGDKFAVRAGRFKYIEAKEEGTRELFDLDNDPGETVNLASEKASDAARLSIAIREWRVGLGKPARAVSDDSEEAAERLRALGYVR